jgi:hypothetical protein
VEELFERCVGRCDQLELAVELNRPRKALQEKLQQKGTPIEALTICAGFVVRNPILDDGNYCAIVLDQTHIDPKRVDYQECVYKEIVSRLGLQDVVHVTRDSGRLRVTATPPWTARHTDAMVDGSNPRATYIAGFTSVTSAIGTLRQCVVQDLGPKSEILITGNASLEEYNLISRDLSSTGAGWEINLSGDVRSSIRAAFYGRSDDNSVSGVVPIMTVSSEDDELPCAVIVDGGSDRYHFELSADKCDAARLREFAEQLGLDDLEFDVVMDQGVVLG